MFLFGPGGVGGCKPPAGISCHDLRAAVPAGTGRGRRPWGTRMDFAPKTNVSLKLFIVFPTSAVPRHLLWFGSRSRQEPGEEVPSPERSE
jgi:hypothetical protein